jgi:glutamate synthase (NADPH/NADH) small chain
VGVNVSINELLRENNALVLAGGSTIPRDLNIPGRDLKGIYFAMDFLTQQNKRNGKPGQQTNSFTEGQIIATEKNVIIIGGGDTGSDCVGTSNRQRANSTTQFELLPKPPLSRTPFMPWPVYPMVLRTSSSQEEGCNREWAIATKEFVGDENGNLIALKIINLEWQVGQDGNPSGFAEVKGTERNIPCELALLAMGFIHPQHEGVLNDLNVDLDEKGNVKADERSYQTNIQKVFTAGDMRRGQSLVVWAISEGRECARKVDEYLMGQSFLETKDENIIAF